MGRLPGSRRSHPARRRSASAGHPRPCRVNPRSPQLGRTPTPLSRLIETRPTSISYREDPMEIETASRPAKGQAERFTGDVWVDVFAQPRPQPHRMTAGIVRFAPRARTAWHVHALGQTLRVTDGIALVQASGGPAVAVHAGETVYTPPGEWHWHGAAESTFM